MVCCTTMWNPGEIDIYFEKCRSEVEMLQMYIKLWRNSRTHFVANFWRYIFKKHYGVLHCMKLILLNNMVVFENICPVWTHAIAETLFSGTITVYVFIKLTVHSIALNDNIKNYYLKITDSKRNRESNTDCIIRLGHRCLDLFSGLWFAEPL